MFPIGKRLTCSNIHPFNNVDWFSVSIKIFFCNENCKSVGEFTELLPSVQIFNIHYTGMEPGTVWVRTLIFSLYFYVILLPGRIRSIGVQAIGNNQIRFTCNNA